MSAVAKQLVAVIAAFHARALQDRYRVLMLDGIVLARRTGADAIISSPETSASRSLPVVIRMKLRELSIQVRIA